MKLVLMFVSQIRNNYYSVLGVRRNEEQINDSNSEKILRQIPIKDQRCNLFNVLHRTGIVL